MFVRSIFAAFALLGAFVVAAAPGAAYAQVMSGEQRVHHVIAAMSAGDTAAFEQMAQANYAPAALARRQPAERAQLVERLHGDFGAMEIVELTSTDNTITARVRGATGAQGTFAFTIGATPDHLIEGMRIEVGGH